MTYLSFTVSGNKLTISVELENSDVTTFETNIMPGLSETDLQATALAFFDNCVQNID